MRGLILDTAKEIVTKDRESQYGSPEDNFGVIADLWSAYFGHEIDFTQEDVAIMLALLKVGRISTGGRKLDNYVDLAGYAACAGEIAMRFTGLGEEKDDEVNG